MKNLSYKISYKQLGIELFRKYKFDEAKSCFSLAYEDEKSEELLSFIELCELAKTEPDEVMSLFEIYINLKLPDQEKEINKIIDILEENSNQFIKELDYENAITYSDFKKLVSKQGNFKTIFQDIMFSTKVIISNKNDLLEFVENLIKNGYKEMGLNYLENSSAIFLGDQRVEKIIKDLGKNSENNA